jgi:hypothetical protein
MSVISLRCNNFSEICYNIVHYRALHVKSNFALFKFMVCIVSNIYIYKIKSKYSVYYELCTICSILPLIRRQFLLIRMSLKQLVFKSTYMPVDETKLTPHFVRDLIIDEVVVSPVYSDSKLTKDTN